MQPAAASKRLLSTLSSKIHPQLPLSPRESQQLLNALTSSFRAHLDREHSAGRRSQSDSKRAGQRTEAQVNARSSHAVATRHIDSILTNPLFAVQPRRRGSESIAIDIMRDPMTWFVNEVASGGATLPKAALCVRLLAETPEDPQGKPKQDDVLARWLRTSGLENSREFIDMNSIRRPFFLEGLVACFQTEYEKDALWRWYIRPADRRMEETSLSADKIATFRASLLANMVKSDTKTSLDKGIATFMQAYRMSDILGHGHAYEVLRPAGSHIVNKIIAGARSVDPDIYQSFLASTENWAGDWSQAVRPLLWLYHPTKSSPLPGLQFIQDPAGAVTFVDSNKSRQDFLVQLCLGVAHSLLAQKKPAEALVAMDFTTQHFSHIVSAKKTAVVEQVPWNVRSQERNIRWLDTLMPA